MLVQNVFTIARAIPLLKPICLLAENESVRDSSQ